MKQNFINNLSLLPVIAMLAGCGSMQTLSPGAKADLAGNEKYRTTRCETIPRTYSGVAYVLCTAYIKQADVTDDKQDNVDSVVKGNPGAQTNKDSSSIPGSSLLDLLLSGVVDTLVLPYTLYKQIDDGSYQLNVDPEIEASRNTLPRKDY